MFGAGDELDDGVTVLFCWSVDLRESFKLRDPQLWRQKQPSQHPQRLTPELFGADSAAVAVGRCVELIREVLGGFDRVGCDGNSADAIHDVAQLSLMASRLFVMEPLEVVDSGKQLA